MLVPLLTCVAMTTVISAQSMNQRKGVLTYNAFLFEGAVTSSSKAERRAAIIDGIRNVNADAVCLQEVFIGEDVQEIAEGLSDVYGHSYSLLHQEGQVPAPSTPTSAACPTNQFRQFLNCARAHKCVDRKSGTFSLTSLVTCVMQFCQKWFMPLSQKCVGCLVYTGLKPGALQECTGAAAVGKTTINSPGLVMLSKYTMTSPRYTDYHPGYTQIFRRGYLDANIEGMGAVTCTHLSSAFPIYMEVHLAAAGLFSSFEEQNADEVGKLLSFVTSTDDPQIVLGDFNTSPAIPEYGILAVFGDHYDTLAASLNTTLPEECTYCYLNYYNDLNMGGDYVLDHVFVRNHHELRVEVVLDDSVVPSSGLPLSDHYGVYGNIRRLKQTAGLRR